MSDPEKGPAGIRMAIALILLKLIDAGLAPWLLVALFVIGTEWSLTRHLNSPDTLIFLSKLLSRAGFTWFGWFVALVEVPLFAWTLRRQHRRHEQKERFLENDATKARELLKKHKQEELKLEG